MVPQIATSNFPDEKIQFYPQKDDLYIDARTLISALASATFPVNFDGEQHAV